MIHQLTFSNFCSFFEESTVDFTATAKTPTDDSFVSRSDDTQVSLLTGVFGPNASGKTNLLKALVFVSFFMRHSYQQLKPNESIPVDRFARSEEHEPTSIELEFDGEECN